MYLIVSSAGDMLEATGAELSLKEDESTYFSLSSVFSDRSSSTSSTSSILFWVSTGNKCKGILKLIIIGYRVNCFMVIMVSLNISKTVNGLITCVLLPIFFCQEKNNQLQIDFPKVLMLNQAQPVKSFCKISICNFFLSPVSLVVHQHL